MRPQHSLVRNGLAAVVTATALLTGTPAHAAEPAIGTCFDGAAAVPCTGPHRTETFFVATLPDTFPDPATATVRQRLDVTANTCTNDRMLAYLGLSMPIPSRFRPIAVFPTPAEYASGERWVRCDVGYDAGRETGVLTQPAPAWVAANAGNPTAFAACTPSTGYSQTPSATKTNITECTNPARQWVLVAKPTIAKIWQKYPGAKSLERKSAAACKPVKNTFHGGLKDPYARGWWYIYPLAKSWEQGVRTTTCWVPLKQYLDTK